MKKVIIKDVANKEVNWNLRQWVQSTTDPSIIVLTTGLHKDDTFTGTALPCEKLIYGSYNDQWAKSCFKILQGSVPFTISNED